MIEQEILPTPECPDKLGAPINVGDIIVYGHALGRCAALRIGKVLKIRAFPARWVSSGSEPTPPTWKILVQGVADGYGYTSKGKTLCKKGTLQFPDRIVVLGHGTSVLPDSASGYVDVLV